MNLTRIKQKNIKKWQILLIIEFIVFLYFAIILITKSSRDLSVIDVSLSDWQSTGYITFDEGWYVDETMLEADMADDKTVCLFGPYINMKKGTYSIEIEYQCDNDQSCQVYANNENDVYIKGGTGKLRKNLRSMSYAFTLTEDIDNFEFVVNYNKHGSLWIKDIEIKPTNIGIRRKFVIILCALFTLNICLYFRKKIEEWKNCLLAIGGITMLVSLPLFVEGIGFHTDQDLMVHLMRIESIAKEICNGNFPVRMSSLYMDGYGYPISVFYGDYLLYIPAVLRIIGFPVVSAYKFYVFLINVGTVIIAYICFKEIFKKEEIAVLTTLAYATAGYRIVCVYVRSAVGEYSAMMFLPLIALAIYRFYVGEADEENYYKRYSLLLALGMSGVIGTHILSTEMIVFVLILVCVVLWKKTFRRKILRTYVLAVIGTIMFSAWFVVPFLDYYKNVEVWVNISADNIARIQDQGAYIGQYFYFFQSIFGGSGVNLQDRMSLTPGMALMLTLVIAVLLWINSKASKKIKFFTLFSMVMLFVASNLFPWNYLGAHYKVGKVLSYVQFPWRYIGMASIFLTLLLGSVCQRLVELDTEYKKYFYVVIAGACLVMSIFYASDYSNGANLVHYYDTAELETYPYGGGGYLRPWTDFSMLSGAIVQENMEEVSLISRDGIYMELYCKGNENEQGKVELPILNYKGYRVTDEYGRNYEITDGANNVVQFVLPAGFSGKVMIDFVEPWYWRISELVSLIAFVYIGIQKIMKIFWKSTNKEVLADE